MSHNLTTLISCFKAAAKIHSRSFDANVIAVTAKALYETFPDPQPGYQNQVPVYVDRRVGFAGGALRAAFIEIAADARLRDNPERIVAARVDELVAAADRAGLVKLVSPRDYRPRQTDSFVV